MRKESLLLVWPWRSRGIDLSTYETKLAALRLPDVSGEYIAIALREIRQEQSAVANNIVQMKTIRSRVQGEVA